MRRLAAVLLAVTLGGPTAGSATDRPVVVATARLLPQAYDVTLPDKVGVLEAGEHRRLAFEVPGRLVALAAEGTLVAAGDEAGRLGDDLERAQVRQAELRLREARSNLSRTTGLKRHEAASERAHENAATAVALRTAELDAAREQLARRHLIVPFAGVIAETLADPGEVVAAGSPVATLMQLEELELRVGVPGYQVGRVRPGADVVVSVPGVGDKRFGGRVERVAPAAAEGRHLFEVDVRVPNPEARLRPGMTARAAIVTRTLAGVLVAPLESVVERNGRRTVFRVESGEARAIDVSDAPLHGDHVLIAAAAGPIEVVVRGQHDLEDGLPVRVDNSVLEAEAAAAEPHGP